jgi:hypothetical protein
LIEAFLGKTCTMAVYTKIEKLGKNYSTAGQHSALSSTHEILKSLQTCSMKNYLGPRQQPTGEMRPYLVLPSRLNITTSASLAARAWDSGAIRLYATMDENTRSAISS